MPYSESDLQNLCENVNNILSSYSPIEKKIHITWKNKDIINKDYNMITYGILQLKMLNPDYIFTIYDDNDVEMYLQSKISETDYELIKNKHIVEKSDLWRLLIIYYEGGIYQDIDRFCNIPLSNIINENTKCVLPMYHDADFSQDIMISCSNNILFKKAIDMNLEIRRNNPNTGIFTLGPITYFKAVTDFLLGKPLFRQPSKENLDALRYILEHSIYLKTYREEPLFNTILYQGPHVNNDKHRMYNEESVKHWHFA